MTERLKQGNHCPMERRYNLFSSGTRWMILKKKTLKKNPSNRKPIYWVQAELLCSKILHSYDKCVSRGGERVWQQPTYFAYKIQGKLRVWGQVYILWPASKFPPPPPLRSVEIFLVFADFLTVIRALKTMGCFYQCIVYVFLSLFPSPFFFFIKSYLKILPCF